MSATHDLIVIGNGITGLCAARQACRDGLSVATIETMFFGGLVLNVNELDGEVAGSGSELAANLMTEVADLGAENINATVASIEPQGDALVVTSDAGRHHARAVIVASGARLRRLGVAGEAELVDRGVSQCADCDGPMYQGKDVVVVGGGDSALQEAGVLAEYTRHVHLVHRGAEFSARPHLVERLAGHANVTLHWQSRVEAVLGTQGVEGVRVRTQEGQDAAVVKEIPCAGFFAYVGLEPACEFVPGQVLRDATGHLMTDAGHQTALAGVYAAGAVRAGYGGLLTHAMAEGVAAASAVARRLRG